MKQRETATIEKVERRIGENTKDTMAEEEDETKIRTRREGEKSKIKGRRKTKLEMTE